MVLTVKVNSKTLAPRKMILYTKCMTIYTYKDDIPADLDLGDVVAIDTETLGLELLRDRLCVVQLSSGDGNAHLVQFGPNNYEAPNLKKLLDNPETQKLFHFARFDVAAIEQYLGILVDNVYCTRTASYFARTYTDRHGLKNLCDELLGVELSKKQQSSFWGAEELTKKQKEYAANDVLFLHQLKAKLDPMLDQEGRLELAESVMRFIPTRAVLDLEGWPQDIFSHNS